MGFNQLVANDTNIEGRIMNRRDEENSEQEGIGQSTGRPWPSPSNHRLRALREAR